MVRIPVVIPLHGRQRVAETMVGKDRDESSGEYEDTYSEQAFLDAISELNGGGTREIADRIGCHRDTARRRLNTLAEEGLVQRRDVGDAAFWTIKNSDNN